MSADRLIRLALAVLAVLVWSATGAQTLPAVIKAPAGVWVSPAVQAAPAGLPPELQQLSSVIEAWDTEVRVDGRRSERYERRMLRIQGTAALDDAGTVRIPYVPDYQTLRFHTLRVWRGGRAMDFLAAAPVRVVQVEEKLAELQITGRAVAVAQVPDLRPGDRLEVAYTLSGQNPVLGDSFALQVPWNGPQYVHQRRVRVVYPQAVNLGYRVLGPLAGLEPALNESAGAGMRELVLARYRVLAAVSDGLVPQGWDPGTSLQLTSFHDWTEVRQWAAGLFALPPPTPGIARLAMDLQRGAGGKREAAERAIRFVQDEIRYFSVAINENTHRPQLPQATLDRRFGDCKDKSLLLAALLSAMSVEATPVLVSVMEGARVRRYLPTPLAFDHVVVRYRLPGGPVNHVDATRTGDGVPSGRLSDELRHGVGLATAAPAGQGAGLEALGAAQPVLWADVVETVKVQALDGGGEFAVKAVLHDRLAEMLRRAERNRSAETRNRMLADQFMQRFGQARTVSGFPVLTDRWAANQIEINERYVAEKVLTRDVQRNIWAARFGALRLVGPLTRAVLERDRALPLGLAEPYSIHRYTVQAELPENVSGREDPVADSMSTPYFRLSTQRSFRGNVFRFSAELQVLASEVPASDMKAFVDSLEELRRKLVDVVVIGDNNVTAQDAPRLGYRETMLARFRKAAEAASRVIEAGRLAEAEVAAAYIERGAARIYLGDLPGASQDIAQAMRRAPGNEAVYGLRASVSLQQKQYAAAEADLGRALALGADAGNTYLRRGQVRFLAGRHAEALQDFQQAEKSSANGLNLGFMQIWQAIAKMRLNQPAGVAPEGVAGWPRPLIELMHGSGTPQQVLAAAQSSSADEQAANLCEAYYYLAQWHMARNEADKAADYLRKAVATGVIHYAEYELAEIALRP